MKIKSLADKITAAVVYMLLIEIAVSLALAINFMYDYHFFTEDSSIYPVQKGMALKVDKEFSQIEDYITLYLKDYLKDETGNELTEQEKASFSNLTHKYKADNTNLVFSAETEDGQINVSNNKIPGKNEFCFSKHKPFSVYVEGKGVIQGSVQIFVLSKGNMKANDGYRLSLNLINAAHKIRYLFFVLLFIIIVVAVVLLGLLMASIGNNTDVKTQKERLYFIDRVPFDLLSIIVAGLIAFIIGMVLLTSAADIKEVSIVLWNVVILILMFVISVIMLAYCITLATRIKIGNLMQNTVVYIIISKIRKKNSKENEGSFRLPILGKALISIGIIMLVELLSIFYFVYKYKTCISGRLEDFKFLYFAFSQLAVLFMLGALFFMIVSNLNRVRESGKKIASGDFDGVADSHIMFGDFKAINDDLITIKDDMIQALKEKTKSQEMRNELITNISHDIKTPLTSIINYADIISSGKCTEEEVKSYSEILTKQSSKLSDLLFNLIEVSKISTGAVKVEFGEINVQLFLSQTIEEFSMRFNEKNLTVESIMPEEEVFIMADGMKLWRVFENLFSNIVKYAMPGTRIYINVVSSDEKVIIMLKNISEKPVLSTPDELLLRFKRDDSSRHTEGNGLGLSIAKSFIEVQNGKFEISVDGDLFKTEITFDRYVKNEK